MRAIVALLLLVLSEPAAARVGVRIEVDGPVEGPFWVHVWTRHPAGIHSSRSEQRDLRLVGPGWWNLATGIQLPILFDAMWIELYHPDFLPESFVTRDLLAFVKPTAVTFRPKRWDDVLAAPGPIPHEPYRNTGLNAALGAPARYLNFYLPALDDAGVAPIPGIERRFAARIAEVLRRSEPAVEDAKLDALVGRVTEALADLRVLLAASRAQRLALRDFQQRAARSLDLDFTPDDTRHLAVSLEATLAAERPDHPAWVRHVWTNHDTKLRWSYLQDLRRPSRKRSEVCEHGRLAVDPGPLVGGTLRPHHVEEYRVWCRSTEGTWHERTDRRRVQ